MKKITIILFLLVFCFNKSLGMPQVPLNADAQVQDMGLGQFVRDPRLVDAMLGTLSQKQQVEVKLAITRRQFQNRRWNNEVKFWGVTSRICDAVAGLAKIAILGSSSLSLSEMGKEYNKIFATSTVMSTIINMACEKMSIYCEKKEEIRQKQVFILEESEKYLSQAVKQSERVEQSEQEVETVQVSAEIAGVI